MKCFLSWRLRDAGRVGSDKLWALLTYVVLISVISAFYWIRYVNVCSRQIVQNKVQIVYEELNKMKHWKIWISLLSDHWTHASVSDTWQKLGSMSKVSIQLLPTLSFSRKDISFLLFLKTRTERGKCTAWNDHPRTKFIQHDNNFPLLTACLLLLLLYARRTNTHS